MRSVDIAGREDISYRKSLRLQKKAAKQKKNRLNRKIDLAQLSMCSFAIVKLIIFSYLPMVGLIMAFQNYIPKLGLNSPWIGFQNFEFFFVSGDALLATFNTVAFNLIFIVSGTIVQLVLALCMFELKNKYFVKGFQTIVFLPYFISWLIVGIILTGMLGRDTGTVTKFCEILFGTAPDFYSEPNYWWIILPVLNIWKGAGVGSIIYYANMLSINKVYYEAAKIDGATRWQCATKITIPFMSTMIITLTLMAIGGIIRSDFGIFYYATRNATLLSPVTTTIDTYVFRAIDNQSDFGLNTAVGLFQSVVGFVLVVTTNWIVRKTDKERAMF
ncbi:MAG: ABC transporter permease subunit [Christensenellales bacterium]